MLIDTTPTKENSPDVPMLFWKMLSADDKKEYLLLKESFQNPNQKERHHSSIQNDLRLVVNFIERRKDLQEPRSIVSGICFTGSYICVNTSQLKCLLGRCKSSINNLFQQLGYVSGKTKVRQYILTVLPLLHRDPSLLRQWTMRCAEPNTRPISIIPLPNILDKRNSSTSSSRNHLPLPILGSSLHSPPRQQVQPDNVGFNSPMSLPKMTEIDTNFDDNLFMNDCLGDLCFPSTVPRPMSTPNFGFEYDDPNRAVNNQNRFGIMMNEDDLKHSEPVEWYSVYDKYE